MNSGVNANGAPWGDIRVFQGATKRLVFTVQTFDADGAPSVGPTNGSYSLSFKNVRTPSDTFAYASASFTVLDAGLGRITVVLQGSDLPSSRAGQNYDAVLWREDTNNPLGYGKLIVVPSPR